MPANAEQQRLAEEEQRQANWKRWGPYLAERQWGTVREDYSPVGDCWSYFPHDHARSRVYRWGEDGLLGFTDRQCRLCFALALWNTHDAILKERLFGLTNPQGNHGEDVKELYYYLDATPTYSYCRSLYKYPQQAFPYQQLIDENATRGKHSREFEILDTGIFDQGRYFDVFAEYAKADPHDILIRITIHNRGPDDAYIHVIPTLWFRNTWIWGCEHEGCTLKPDIRRVDTTTLATDHETLDPMYLTVQPAGSQQNNPADPGLHPTFLFTENESNNRRLWGVDNYTPYAKDAFHERIVNDATDAVRQDEHGTKAGMWYALHIPTGTSQELRLRLYTDTEPRPDTLGDAFVEVFNTRRREADEFYNTVIPTCRNKPQPQREPAMQDEQQRIQRQAYAGMLYSKQFYHYSVMDWLKGDPDIAPPPPERWHGRNVAWRHHLFNRDVISMPDSWEYPWYAAWDLAFHMLPFTHIDPTFAKRQLVLLLREWYMHPNGQIPAYEFEFDDVNPPVHAWACLQVYQATKRDGTGDIHFLARVFQKLLINFTWWVNRKDIMGKNLFAGGFLGLDNIGIFDRSRPLPAGEHLEQADGTAWMAFYCLTMLAMAMELARHDAAYEDVASKFFEHFIAIADAMNTLDGSGLWNDEDGFYYDHLHVNGQALSLKIRSLVGLVPLCAVTILDDDLLEQLPGFRRRMQWFLQYRSDLANQITYLQELDNGTSRYLLAIPSRERLERVLTYMFSEQEFLSPYGIRSLSRYHKDHPYRFTIDGNEHYVQYLPAESDSDMFGGNSNWRGPVWFPLNYLLIDALRTYHRFYGRSLQIEYPTGSGVQCDLATVADDISRRLANLFVPDDTGVRPCHRHETIYATDPHFRDLLLFYEYFDGDTGRGAGASHQTGWTGLVANLLRDCTKGH